MTEPRMTDRAGRASMMSTILGVLAIAALTLPGALAQDGTSTDEDQPTQTTDSAPPKPAPAPAPKEKEFVPFDADREISRDVPVSFPADI